MYAEGVPPGTDQMHSLVSDFFPWPPHTLHILSLLQDGFAEDVGRLPADLRESSAELIRSAFAHGRLEDKRIAVEVSGVLRDEDLLPILRSAVSFGGGN